MFLYGFCIIFLLLFSVKIAKNWRVYIAHGDSLLMAAEWRNICSLVLSKHLSAEFLPMPSVSTKWSRVTVSGFDWQGEVFHTHRSGCVESVRFITGCLINLADEHFKVNHLPNGTFCAQIRYLDAITMARCFGRITRRLSEDVTENQMAEPFGRLTAL